MPKSISLNAAEIDCLFCLTHTLYIANTLSSLLSPSFEPQMRVLAGRLNALLKVRDTEAITLPAVMQENGSIGILVSCGMHSLKKGVGYM